jgi:hypothetical protein
MRDSHVIIQTQLLSKRPNSKGWVRVNCPLCVERGEPTPDKKLSLGVQVNSGWFHCWRCDAKGFLDGTDRTDFEKRAPKDGFKSIDLPEGFFLLDENKCESLQPAWDYLTNHRNLSEDEIRLHCIGACLTGRFAGRVVIPVYSNDDRIVYWVTRKWVRKCSKPYLNPSHEREGLFFGEELLVEESSIPLLCVEGVFDAIAHYPHAVATLGKVTEPHLERLMKVRRPVVFVRDGDARDEGICCALRMQMNGFAYGTGSVDLGAKVDPDEITHEVLMYEAELSLTTWKAIMEQRQ